MTLRQRWERRGMPSCLLTHDADGYEPGARCTDGARHPEPEPVDLASGAVVGHLCPACGVKMKWSAGLRCWMPYTDDGRPIPMLPCPNYHQRWANLH